jgi:surfactin synthase thioesterase subunit
MRRVGGALFRLGEGEGEQPVRLVCCPHAGGSARHFNGWQDAAGADADVLAVTLPGRGTRIRDPLLEDMGAIGRALADDLEPLLDRPYALFGHSMGGLVAYETARRIESRGLRPPTVLGISATPAPPSAPASAATRQSDAELLDRLRAFEATPEAAFASSSAINALLPAIRADFAACDAYAPAYGSPLEVPVVAWAGSRDAVAPPPRVAEWRACVSGGWRLTELPEGHFYLDRHRESIVRGLLSSFEPATKPGG